MAYLTLEDGTVFEGESFGAQKTAIGEVVFNTGMIGYPEVLTDPSYTGQLVNMTYPLIGNYGITFEDLESDTPGVGAMIIRELCEQPNNWRSEGTLGDYMKANGITGLAGIDTRALTRHIRNNGTMRGIITMEKPTDEEIAAMKSFKLEGAVDKATCKETYTVGEGEIKVAVLDFGLERSLLQGLVDRGVQCTVFPAYTPAQQIIDQGFDGIMLTGGPGDPQDYPQLVASVKKLIDDTEWPIFAARMGHEIMALAMGVKIEKLKYGHRGSNHPVRDIASGRVLITSQNHGYNIMEDSLPEWAEVTFRNVNDGTVEGVRYNGKSMYSVQFNPVARDTAYLFEEFLTMMQNGKQVK
ncbi:MAG: carbamoyl phosphate synthase small subunit [Christensenellaceae bacterium]|nr:carbamoyl phosphate synthase small subunit [Christensenellaceae bacterium]